YIASVMSADDGDAWFVDDVSVYDNTPCVPPTQGTAFTATALDGGLGTATLNWTRGADDNVLVVMRAGSAVNADPIIGTSYTANASFGSGDVLSADNFVVYAGPASSVEVTGLEVNTTYHVAIYEYGAPNCYNTDELTGNFLVPCDTYGLPFSENFDAAASVPDCWAVFDNAIGTDVSWNVDSTNPNGGTNAAYLDWEATFVDPSNAEDWLVTPAIDLTNVADAELTFYTMTSGNPNDTAISTYTIRISTGSQTNTADFTIVETFTEADLGAAYNQKTINLAAYAGQTVHIAFVMEQDINAGGDDWSVDDVMVEAIIPVQNELFFSEYIEGSSSNKYLEIYNPT